MTTTNFKRTKLACYTAYFTMSSVFCLPPLLFVTFRNTFGLSYTLLGTLILINFCTQLAVDLFFTALSGKLKTEAIVRIMPLVTTFGLLVYALIPTLFPNIAYLGLVIGTVIFSVSAGLSEVLLSPTIAAIPSDNPQRDMSALHSLYAFGVFSVATVSTVFLKIFGTHNWAWIVGFFAFLPVIAAVLFMTSPMPDMSSAHTENGSLRPKNNTVGVVLCVACIFFGSCAENAMSNWISSFMEKALKIDKALGDILGLALFAILLGLTRILYSKFGKNIFNMLLIGMVGASVCYLVVGLSSSLVLAFIACVLTGTFVAMLWPGTLIMMEEKMPRLGVSAYALMAASGDLGASVAPQLLGIVTDTVSASALGARLATSLSLTAEQIGLKAGMLVTAIFPILGATVVIIAMRYFKKQEKTDLLQLK
ncbi:MAG: MFS transporter [Clostridia bacterium]|nr:MFS transporter [Clostridia bacterium]